MDVRERNADTTMARLSKFLIPEKILIWFRVPERQIYFVIALAFSISVVDYVLSIMITLLTEVWHQKLITAVLVTSIQGGTSEVLKILMATQAFLGDFWMLVLSTTAYTTGLGLLRYSYPKFTNEEINDCNDYFECPPKRLTFPFLVALVLLTVGKSGSETFLEQFSPNELEASQDQNDEISTDGQETNTANRDATRGEQTNRDKIIACYIWFMIFVIGSLVGSFVFPYNIGWSEAFLISAYMMGASLLLLLLGTLFYSPRKPCGSPLTSIARVFKAAVLKMKRHIKDDTLMACEGCSREIHYHTMKSLTDGRESHGLICLTKTTRCLDKYLNKAAIIEHSGDDVDLSSQETGRRLCTVQQVEVTGLIIRMLPMSATFFMYGIVRAVGDTFFIEQGYGMDAKLGAIRDFPLQAFVLMSKVAGKIASKMYDKILATRIQAAQKRVSDAIKIGLGLLISIFCCVTASWVEARRLKVIKENHLLDSASSYTVPMTIFWLTPQFLLMGAMDGLTYDGIEGFFSHQGPIAMKRYAVAMADFVTGMGTILSIAVIFLVRKVSKGKDGQEGWFAESIDSSHLDYFYRALSIVSLVNFLFYAIIASNYSYKFTRQDEEEEYDIVWEHFERFILKLKNRCLYFFRGNLSNV